MPEQRDRVYDQAYGGTFAKVYNRYWTHFARRVGPQIADFFDADRAMTGTPRTLLDLCCGTGQVAAEFLRRSYQVTGIDLSPPMIEHAIENNRPAIERGTASFLIGDASSFHLPSKVSFALSVFDALNHLPDLAALGACFSCVWDSLSSPGLFVFDLNTPAAFLQNWNGIDVRDTEEATIINRGIYASGSDRALVSISGFLRTASGLYERFTQKIYETVFETDAVMELLSATGFSERYIACPGELGRAEEDPAAALRAFFVCRKR